VQPFCLDMTVFRSIDFLGDIFCRVKRQEANVERRPQHPILQA
jgi:hypothetical protein